MLLSDVTDEHIGQKVTIDKEIGSFVGIVAWVDRVSYLHFNRGKYLIEPFGRNVRAEEIPYTGQKDYYHKITKVRVGFYGNRDFEIDVKEEYDIDVEDPKHAAYLRKQTGGL